MWLGIEEGSCVSMLSRQCVMIRKFRAVYPNQVVKSRPKGRRLTHSVPSLQAPSTLSVRGSRPEQLSHPGRAGGSFAGSRSHLASLALL